jgi:hypothetical protein
MTVDADGTRRKDSQMRWRHKERAGALLVAAAVVLVGASQASAALSPKLTVATTEATNTTAISYAQGATDTTLARVVFYLPTSVFAPAAQLPGDPVGTAKLVGTGASGAAETLNATIAAGTATDPVSINGVTMTMAQAWKACIGTVPPGSANTTAYWLMNFTGSETTAFPIFFASINQDQPLGSQFLASMNICFPTGFKAQSLDLSLVDAISTTQGWSVWHSLSLPQVGAPPTLAGSAEAEAQDRLSWDVSGTAKHSSKGKLKGMTTVSGKATQGGAGVAGKVQVLSGKKVLATFTSGKNGKFTGSFKSTAKSLTFHATSSPVTLPACVEPAFGPAAPCTSSIVSGIDVKSDAPVSVKQ